MVRLRPMTESEFPAFQEGEVGAYAQEQARNLRTTLEDELAQAREWIGKVLPDGIRTIGHHFWVLVDDQDAVLGHVWADVNEAQHFAWILSVEIGAAYRGQGYGRRMLELLEDELRPLGVQRIGLNVFADNTVAQHLYERLGYRVTNFNLQKTL
jgi:ribosomal protein S18 acetylase RimI-like enzyme